MVDWEEMPVAQMAKLVGGVDRRINTAAEAGRG